MCISIGNLKGEEFLDETELYEISQFKDDDEESSISIANSSILSVVQVRLRQLIHTYIYIYKT